MTRFSRRDLLATFLGVPCALAAGCRSAPPPLAGEFVGADLHRGHRLRDEPPPTVPDDAWQNKAVVIVGGGIAGLSAARQLLRLGIDDFVVLELEAAAGGTSRGGQRNGMVFPWGAHYVPVPAATNLPLIELLEEMQILEGRETDGRPRVAEQYLCREPQERLFFDGQWHDDLDPLIDATADERDQWRRFQAECLAWYQWRDGDGRPAFTMPLRTVSDDREVTGLDRQSFAEWLDERRITAPRVRWIAEYACRDDYGAFLDQTSAWAGLFYFVSRMTDAGGAHQPLMTWPEGNARIVQHLVRCAARQLQLDTAVAQIRCIENGDQPSCEVVARVGPAGQPRGFRTQRVIFASPRFLAAHVLHRDGAPLVSREEARAFVYGSWFVANLHLSARPFEPGFPLAWDNVLYDSPSLGYVTATHQRGIDHGPTVFTYYYPLCDRDAQASRQQLLTLSWEECAELVVSDLERAHPDLRSLLTRIDIMRWGHAMVRPTPDFVWSAARRNAAQPRHAVHFAHTDLSGMALLEEAFDHGVRAANEVAAIVRGRVTAP